MVVGMDFRLSLLNENKSIKEAMLCMQNSNAGICLVVNDQDQLIGTITDGDIRRGLLKAISLEENCRKVMTKNPKSMPDGATKKQILKQMEKASVQQMPLLDSMGKVVNLFTYKQLTSHESYENIVFINAGGYGKRLLPLTENLPKPLLTVGNKPILENIIENFRSNGFRNFYISVNYKGEMIKDYFGNGSKWDVKITYLTETSPLGTAGSLAFLKEKTQLPVLVCNGDLLTNVDYDGLLNYHNRSGCAATMCVREYQMQIQYGVVEIENGKMTSLIEKPVQKFFISAGIYVLSPKSLEHLTIDQPMDMPDLLLKINAQVASGGVSTFPIYEYWLDIGHIDDFNRAQSEIPKSWK
jgi:dTDP-glucose pyrophosphorylase/predicted transcriptional regulator